MKKEKTAIRKKREKMSEVHFILPSGYYGSNFTACGFTYISNKKTTTNKNKVTCKNCKNTTQYKTNNTVIRVRKPKSEEK